MLMGRRNKARKPENLPGNNYSIINLSGDKEMIKILTSLLIAITVLVSCQVNNSGHKQEEYIKPDSTYVPLHAKGFVINYYPEYSQIVLKDPWGDSTKYQTFALLKNKAVFEKASKQNDYVLNYPTAKWIALSSTMVDYADKLNMKHTISGVAEPQYIADAYIQEQIDKGTIRNIGLAVAPDVEVLIDLEPDFMMVSPFKDNHFAAIESAGIPVVTNSDYLEHTPLGRAEWLVFVGELLGEGEKAKQQFKAIEQEYLLVKEKALKAVSKPTVFTGHIYQGIWYTPAGESYMANFFNDAGCDYIYKDTKGTGSLSLDYEVIIDKAENTDYWLLIINYPTDITYSEIEKIDTRYVDFGAYKHRNIIITNASNSLYFEKGLLQPHIVLSDLVYAVHPGLMGDYKPTYFTHLKAE